MQTVEYGFFYRGKIALAEAVKQATTRAKNRPRGIEADKRQEKKTEKKKKGMQDFSRKHSNIQRILRRRLREVARLLGWSTGNKWSESALEATHPGAVG
jgi:hypothetical protein